MGGSGGGNYFPPPSDDLQNLIERTKEEEKRKQLESDVNRLLREQLANFERDPDRVNEYLMDIADLLKDAAGMEKFLYGGSVAKHTYVDGLSDVDALVVLQGEETRGKSPQAILDQIARTLRARLAPDKVQKVEKGALAVTVTYSDGTEIQLLPAIRSGDDIAIPAAGGQGWRHTDPMVFREALSAANARLNGTLVPAIKLVKSILSTLPEEKRLEGYHVESLALEANKGYRGPSTLQQVLLRVLERSVERVLKPIADVTGQSRTVDGYLGPADSSQRHEVSRALSGVLGRLQAATTVDQWKGILEE
jgi:hypothetical protein